MVSHSLHSQASNGLLTSLSHLLPHFSFTNSFLTQSQVLSLLSHSLFLPSFRFPTNLSLSNLLPSSLPLVGSDLTHSLVFTRLASHSHSRFLITHRVLSFEFAALITFPLQALVQPSHFTRQDSWLSLPPLASLCCFTTTNKVASQSQSFLCFSSVSSLHFLYSNFCPTTTFIWFIL